MRVLALDVGQRRIGVAVSDPSGMLARPLTVVRRVRQVQDLQAIVALQQREGAERVLVGLPLTLSGEVGPQAEWTLRFVDALKAALGDVPVETWDERYTTVDASTSLRAQGVKAKDQRSTIDMVAAAVLLQSYLDQRKTGESSPL